MKMRITKENLALISMVLGIVILALNTIGCIGYGLYMWGGQGMDLGPSAWIAFKTWLMLGFVGIVMTIGGFVFAY